MRHLDCAACSSKCLRAPGKVASLYSIWSNEKERNTWEGGDESEDRDTGKGRNPVTTTIQHNTTMSPLYMVLSSSFSWLTWFAPEPSCDHNDTTTLHLYMVLSSSLSATKKQQKGSNNNNNNNKKNKKTMTPSTPLGSFNLKTLLQSTRCWSRTPPPLEQHTLKRVLCNRFY